MFANVFDSFWVSFVRSEVKFIIFIFSAIRVATLTMGGIGLRLCRTMSAKCSRASEEVKRRPPYASNWKCQQRRMRWMVIFSTYRFTVQVGLALKVKDFLCDM